MNFDAKIPFGEGFAERNIFIKNGFAEQEDEYTIHLKTPNFKITLSQFEADDKRMVNLLFSYPVNNGESTNCGILTIDRRHHDVHMELTRVYVNVLLSSIGIHFCHGNVGYEVPLSTDNFSRFDISLYLKSDLNGEVVRVDSFTFDGNVSLSHHSYDLIIRYLDYNFQKQLVLSDTSPSTLYALFEEENTEYLKQQILSFMTNEIFIDIYKVYNYVTKSLNHVKL